MQLSSTILLKSVEHLGHKIGGHGRQYSSGSTPASIPYDKKHQMRIQAFCKGIISKIWLTSYSGVALVGKVGIQNWESGAAGPQGPP